MKDAVVEFRWRRYTHRQVARLLLDLQKAGLFVKLWGRTNGEWECTLRHEDQEWSERSYWGATMWLAVKAAVEAMEQG